jgi:YgiT-type zinc finger domain-containing protein
MVGHIPILRVFSLGVQVKTAKRCFALQSNTPIIPTVPMECKAALCARFIGDSDNKLNIYKDFIKDLTIWNSGMICEICGGETRKKKVKRQHWLRGKLFIVEDVGAEVCIDCGERYFHATVLDDIDRYVSTKHLVKKQINVEVVSMGFAFA